MNFSYRTVSQKMLSIVYNKIFARTNWKKRERTKWNKKKNEQEWQCALRSISNTSESIENCPKRTSNSNKFLPND